MDFNTFNEILPEKSSRKVTTRKGKVIKTKNGELSIISRVGVITEYIPESGFKVKVTINSEKVTLLIPNSKLTLKSNFLYALPGNDKAETWRKAPLQGEIKPEKVNEVSKYWSNLCPKLEIIVYMTTNLEIVDYEVPTDN